VSAKQRPRESKEEKKEKFQGLSKAFDVAARFDNG
jgi:hypothetical protein